MSTLRFVDVANPVLIKHTARGRLTIIPDSPISEEGPNDWQLLRAHELHLLNPLPYPESSLWCRLNKQHLLFSISLFLPSTVVCQMNNSCSLKSVRLGVEAPDSKGTSKGCSGGTTGLSEILGPSAIQWDVGISFTAPGCAHRAQVQLMLYFSTYNPNLSLTMIENMSDRAQRLKAPALVAVLPVPGTRAPLIKWAMPAGQEQELEHQTANNIPKSWRLGKHTIMTGRSNSISASTMYFRTEISTRDVTSLPGEFHLAHLAVLEEVELFPCITSVCKWSEQSNYTSSKYRLASGGGEWKSETDQQTLPLILKVKLLQLMTMAFH